MPAYKLVSTENRGKRKKPYGSEGKSPSTSNEPKVMKLIHPDDIKKEPKDERERNLKERKNPRAERMQLDPAVNPFLNDPKPLRDDQPGINLVPKEEVYVNAYYAKTHDGNEYYAKTADDNEYFLDHKYAKHQVPNENGEIEIIEVPPKTSADVVQYMEVDGIIQYPENITLGRLILPKDPDTNEEKYDQDDQGVFKYPLKRNGAESYRIDAQGREVPIPERGYAKDECGTQIYPKDETGTERYMMNLDDFGSPTEVAAIKVLESGELLPYYAKKSNGDEYYPKRYPNKGLFVYPYFMEEQVKRWLEEQEAKVKEDEAKVNVEESKVKEEDIENKVVFEDKPKVEEETDESDG